MNDVIQMQINKDNQAVNNQQAQSIDDILSKHKNINNNKNNITNKIKTNNQKQIIINNELITKEKNFIKKPIKKNYKNIFPIIFQSFLGFIALIDFFSFLFSRYVRIFLLYNCN